MGKVLKALLPVIVAVAIPFAAPAIAATAFMAPVVASVGMTATSALVGAGLGAVGAKVTGGDVGRGALTGAIGGGIGGYTAGQAAATQAAAASPYSLASGATGQGITAGVGGGTGLTLGSSGGAGLTLPSTVSAAVPGAVDYSLATLAPSLAGTGAGLAVAPTVAASPYSLASMPVYGTGAGLAAGTSPFMGAPGGGIAVAPGAAPVLGEPTSFINQPPPPPVFATTPAAPTPTPAQAPATAATRPAIAPSINPATGQPYTFGEALAQVPAQIAAKFTDPTNLADLILRAGGQLAGSALAGEGLSEEERALLAAQTEELRRLQQENKALFNQRLEQAQALIGESKYFDPEYFGLQRARRAQIAGARAKRAGLRGLTGASREAAARKYELETARNVGTAFDEGFGTGVRGRYQALQTGLQMMPESFPSSMGAYETIRGAYEQAAKRRDERAGQIGDLFGSITGTQEARRPG